MGDIAPELLDDPPLKQLCDSLALTKVLECFTAVEDEDEMQLAFGISSEHYEQTKPEPPKPKKRKHAAEAQPEADEAQAGESSPGYNPFHESNPAGEMTKAQRKR